MGSISSQCGDAAAVAASNQERASHTAISSTERGSVPLANAGVVITGGRSCIVDGREASKIAQDAAVVPGGNGKEVKEVVQRIRRSKKNKVSSESAEKKGILFPSLPSVFLQNLKSGERSVAMP